jgi:glucokinase
MKQQGDRDGLRAVWIGVDIGGTKTGIAISAAAPAILGRIEFPTLPEDGPARALSLIQKNIDELLDRFCIQRGQVEAIGVSCGGPLDRVNGIIQAPPNLMTWVDVPIKAILETEFGVECRLENDANAGAVAEFRFGAGRGVQHMVFLTMGTGMGAGIIVDGRLYRGASDLAGEIGHVRLTSFGPTGHNKTGSVEGWASGGGMAEVAEQEIAAARERGDATLMAEAFRMQGMLTAKDVAVAAQQGDALAQRIVHDTGCRLGEALAILVDILNPQRIVIGGLALRLGESLLGPARAAMQREAIGASAAFCQVVPASLGEQIGDIAAISVAMGL